MYLRPTNPLLGLRYLVKGALLAADVNVGPSPQTVEAELARYQALAAGAIY